ncbi:Fc.00g013790.m01.CDS01 [Cosmosporella sp. VM-42]
MSALQDEAFTSIDGEECTGTGLPTTSTTTLTRTVSMTPLSTLVSSAPTTTTAIVPNQDQLQETTPSVVQVTTTIDPILQDPIEISITTTIIASSNCTCTSPIISTPTSSSSSSSSSTSISSILFVPSSAVDTPVFASIAPTTSIIDDPQPTDTPATTPVDAPADQPAGRLPATTQVDEPAEETIQPTIQPTTQEVNEPVATQVPPTTQVDAPAEETDRPAGRLPATTQVDAPAETVEPTTQESVPETTQATATQSDKEPLPAILVPADPTSTVLEQDPTASISSSDPTSEVPGSSTVESSEPSTTVEETGTTSKPVSTQTTDDPISATLLIDTSQPALVAPQPTFTTEIVITGASATATATGALGGTPATDETGGSGTSSENSNINVKDQGSSPSTPVLVGSVVGSLAAVLLIAVLLFLWRRRAANKRRSTLLTPLSVPPPMSSRDKYEIDNASVGPTARSTKLAAAVSANAKRIGHKVSQSFSSGSHELPMDNGSPHSMAAGYAHSRNSSAPESGVFGWWSRVRNKDSKPDHYTARGMSEKRGGDRHSGFSDSQFDRDNQPIRVNPHNRGASLAGGFFGHPSPTRPNRPSDLESLDLDPFSDANAARGGFMRRSDPFSDNNSIKPPIPARRHPSNYVEVHRRGQSLNQQSFQPWGINTNGKALPAPPPSAGSFETRRNRIRSDPFDLEVDGTQRSNNSNPMPPPAAGDSTYAWQRPVSMLSRGDSTSSKYSSGVSSIGDDWNGPGPAVRPLRSRDGQELGEHTNVGGPQRSPGVGKAW